MRITLRSVMKSLRNDQVNDWLECISIGSKTSRMFIHFCYDNFRNQMEIMHEAFVNTPDGERLFNEYLDSFDTDENREAMRGDLMRDKERDK